MTQEPVIYDKMAVLTCLFAAFQYGHFCISIYFMRLNDNTRIDETVIKVIPLVGCTSSSSLQHKTVLFQKDALVPSGAQHDFGQVFRHANIHHH